MDTYSYKIGALLVFAGITSTGISTNISTNISMPVSDCTYADISVIDTRSDRLKSLSDIVVNVPKKKNYREIYKKLVSSKMYKSAYSNRSLGEVTIIED